MNAVVISVEHTSGTVAGTRWLHTVSVDGELVKVTVRPASPGFNMECQAKCEVAMAAIGAVSKNPMGE